MEFRIITSGDWLPVHCFQVEIEIKSVDNSEINSWRKANYRFSQSVMVGSGKLYLPESVVGAIESTPHQLWGGGVGKGGSALHIASSLHRNIINDLWNSHLRPSDLNRIILFSHQASGNWRGQVDYLVELKQTKNYLKLQELLGLECTI